MMRADLAFSRRPAGRGWRWLRRRSSPGQSGAQAQGLPLVVAQGRGGTSYSVPIQTLLFFTCP